MAAGSLQRDCGNCRDSRRLLRWTDSDSLIDSLVPPTVLHSDPMLTLVSLAYICLCQQQGGAVPWALSARLHCRSTTVVKH